MAKPFLQIKNLAVDFATRRGVVHAVDDININLNKGEVIAIVGESGSGKSVTAYSILNLLGNNGKIAKGSITFDGMNLENPSASLLKDIRGREIAMIFQNPMSTLNPIRKVGDQLSDMLRQHAQATNQTAPRKVIELLHKVEIQDTRRVTNAYPFELSGGMCQRVMIALALACNSRLLIADEPTTGLDVTTQKSIMDLIMGLVKHRNLAVILITHDLGMAYQYCDKFVVMEKGQVVEACDDHSLFTSPQHSYTKKLLAATPGISSKVEHLTPTVPVELSKPAVEIEKKELLKVEGLVKTYILKSQGGFKSQGNTFNAVDGVNFTIYQGECVGLVGESGCGKSTTSRLIARLEQPSEGRILFLGEDIGQVSDHDFIRSPRRKDIQMVFQDPTGSLNPRHSAFQLISEPILRLQKDFNKANLKDQVYQLAEKVGLPLELIYRLPHQLSGGQKARVGIARAIALNPKLLILDEPTSALDVSVQAIVLQLLEHLRREHNLSYLFVSHDLNVVRMLSQRILVMQSGKIVESGETAEVMSKPKHLFTKTLLAAIPQLAS